MERVSFKGGALTAPIPAAIVTVGNVEEYGMLTVSWTGILATVPPKTYVSIRPSRHSHSILKDGGEFVINLPSADMARAVDYIGIYTGKKVDKFSKCALTKVKSKCVSPPTVAECPIAIECVVTEVISMGSHDVFVADIVSVSCHEELVDSEGKIRFDRANLLAYAHGEYFGLGDKVGKFGFSTDKAQRRNPSSRGIEKNAESGALSAAGVKPRKTRVGTDGADTEKPKKKNGTADVGDKVPFYLGVKTKAKSKRKDLKGADKGRPHGKRTKKVKEVK